MTFIISPLTNKRIKFLGRTHRQLIKKDYSAKGYTDLLPNGYKLTDRGSIKKVRFTPEQEELPDFDDELINIVQTKSKKKKKKELAELYEKLSQYKQLQVIKFRKPYQQTLFNDQRLKAIVYDVETNYVLAPETFNDIARTLVELYNRQNFTKNEKLTIKMTFQAGVQFTSMTISSDEMRYIKTPLYKYIITKLEQFYAKMAQSEFNIQLKSFSFLVVKKRVETRGGCNKGKKDLMPTEELQVKFNTHNTRRIKSLSPMSTKENCGIMCVLKFLGIKGNELKPDFIRQELNIPENTQLTPSQIGQIVRYICQVRNINVGLTISDINGKMLFIQNILQDTEQDKIINILLRNNHYYLILEVEQYCDECRKFYMKSHTCDITRKSFVNSKVLPKGMRNKQVEIRNPNNEKELDYSKLIVYDLETFEHQGKLVPYTCGYIIGNNDNEVSMPYGKNCMNEFVEKILNYERHIITAYNTSRFDSYFLMDHLVNRTDVEISNIIISNGKIMSFEFNKIGRKSNKVFDLFLFLMTGLKKACEDFDTEFQKGDFDHSKMKSWNDTEKFKEEVLEYLRFDVLSLRELLIKANKTIYKVEQANLTSYITLSNMAYKMWSSKKYLKVLEKLNSFVELFDSVEKYNFVLRGTYGGRTYPMKKEFISSAWETIKERNEKRKSEGMDAKESNKIAYRELLESKDFIFNGDCTSLYPSAMKFYTYPVGASRWSTSCKEEFDKGKLGFYEIEFEPPKNIRLAYLPRKKANGGIEWSLYNGRGIYTNVDISCAIECGYTVKFVGECLVWDNSTTELFTDYINTWYDMKEKASREENAVMKALSKLFLNGLYGKMLQRPIFDTTKICNNVCEFYDFIDEYRITDWTSVGKGKIILKGDTREAMKSEKITKPSYLGAFILSYSRKHMLKFFKAIDPTLKSCMFNYTDTDSIRCTGENYLKLKQMGLILPIKESKLGFLCNDVKKEGLIFYEKCLAPKTYMYYYINEDGEIKEKECGVMKSKGIPNDKLKPEFYSDDEDINREVEIHTMKKVHTRVTKKESERGIQNFNIYNDVINRTFGTSWDGMIFYNGDWFPKGYVFT